MIQWQEVASSSPVVFWLGYLCWHVYWWSGWIAIDGENEGLNERNPVPREYGKDGVAVGGYRQNSSS